jgi:hypothetical protein
LPKIAATFGVGRKPAGGPDRIISRTVQLFGQGEGDICKSAVILPNASGYQNPADVICNMIYVEALVEKLWFMNPLAYFK